MKRAIAVVALVFASSVMTWCGGWLSGRASVEPGSITLMADGRLENSEVDGCRVLVRGPRARVTDNKITGTRGYPGITTVPMFHQDSAYNVHWLTDGAIIAGNHIPEGK